MEAKFSFNNIAPNGLNHSETRLFAGCATEWFSVLGLLINVCFIKHNKIT